ncbi:MAG: universal stress protein [Dehalococcoidia bacterium]
MRHGCILVPLDGSAQAEGALPAAMTLARVEARSIELLAVVEPLDELPDGDRLAPLIAEGLRTRLHSSAEQLRVSGLGVEVAVRYGDPADVILAHAAERSAALIVMATHGAGGLRRWVVGSAADKVLRLAPCPVLLRPPASPLEDRLTPWQPKRFLVPLDGSSLAESALPLARSWAASLGAELLLARAQPWTAVQFAIVDGYLPDLGAPDEEAARAAADYLVEQGRHMTPGTAVRTMVLRGSPADQLLDLAERESIDAVIMTSHGRGGLRRLALGSVADRLVRAGLCVCIIHAADERASVEPLLPAMTTEGKPSP